MTGKRKIATKTEILEHFTSVLRGELNEAKVSDMNRAAEFLDKYYSSREEKKDAAECAVIIDDIPKE